MGIRKWEVGNPDGGNGEREWEKAIPTNLRYGSGTNSPLSRARSAMALSRAS